MSKERTNTADESWSQDDERLLENLLHEAGPRAALPEDFAEVKAASLAAWHEKVSRSRRPQSRRWVTAAAVAASIVILSGLAIQRLRSTSESAVASVGVLSARWGTIEITPSPGTDDAISPGTVLNTRDGRALLRLSTGESVRIAEASRVILETATRLTLEKGKIYVDSGIEPTVGGRLAIETPHGTVHEIGTQFEVRLEQNQLLVRVREGSIELRQNGDVHAARAGQQLVVNGKTEITDIQIYGDSWSWVLATTVPLQIEGASLHRFLEWITRESGWQLEFSDPDLELEATSITFHGPIAELRPDEALDAILAGSGLSYELDQGRLIIERGD